MNASNKILFATLAAALSFCVFANDAEWSWRLPAAHYRVLDVPQRAAYDRCARLHEMGEKAQRENRAADAATAFRAAANEWKRFTVEFADAPEDAIAYAHFMQGYDTHLAKDRNKAVAMYTEVLDFYPDAPYALVAALYWRGAAHAENGDRAKSVADWDETTAIEGNAGHPLALRALENLASDAWTRMQWDAAAARWEEVLADHPTGAASTRRAAALRLMKLRAAQGRWQGVDRATELATGGDAKAAAELTGHFMWDFWHHELNNGKLRREFFDRAFPTESDAKKNERATALRRELVNWYTGKSALFAEAGREWDHALAVFNYNRMAGYDTLQKLAEPLAKTLRAADLAPAEKERRARDLMNHFADAKLAVEARALLDLVQNPGERLRTAFHIEERAGNYADAERVLKEMEMQADPEFVRDAKARRAYLYKDRMNRFNDAVPLFTEAVDPPRSLWGIQECYRRAGKKNEAQRVLSEIAAMFPDDAARAVFEKAEYFRADNDKASAIAYYKRLLAHPEWKKTGESSRAHQRLEELGVDSGGAVIHAVN